MATTPINLLEEAQQELVRAQGRVLTALAQMKLENRTAPKQPTEEKSNHA